MVSGAVDYNALEFYGLQPMAGRFFDRDHGDDGRLVEGETTGNPSIVINETAMRKLGFSSPTQAVGQIVTWNRRRWSAKPNPGTLGSSEIIGVSPDFGLDTRRDVYPQILDVDPISFSVLSVRWRSASERPWAQVGSISSASLSGSSRVPFYGQTSLRGHVCTSS